MKVEVKEPSIIGRWCYNKDLPDVLYFIESIGDDNRCKAIAITTEGKPFISTTNHVKLFVPIPSDTVVTIHI